MKQHIDRFFKDAEGNIVIGQWPNIWLWGWIAFTLLARILSAGVLRNISEAAAFVSIIIWGLLEIKDGVNYFRRALGVLVVIAVVISKL